MTTYKQRDEPPRMCFHELISPCLKCVDFLNKTTWNMNLVSVCYFVGGTMKKSLCPNIIILNDCSVVIRKGYIGFSKWILKLLEMIKMWSDCISQYFVSNWNSHQLSWSIWLIIVVCPRMSFVLKDSRVIKAKHYPKEITWHIWTTIRFSRHNPSIPWNHHHLYYRSCDKKKQRKSAFARYRAIASYKIYTGMIADSNSLKIGTIDKQAIQKEHQHLLDTRTFFFRMECQLFRDTSVRHSTTIWNHVPGEACTLISIHGKKIFLGRRKTNYFNLYNSLRSFGAWDNIWDLERATNIYRLTWNSHVWSWFRFKFDGKQGDATKMQRKVSRTLIDYSGSNWGLIGRHNELVMTPQACQLLGVVSILNLAAPGNKRDSTCSPSSRSSLCSRCAAHLHSASRTERRPKRVQCLRAFSISYNYPNLLKIKWMICVLNFEYFENWNYGKNIMKTSFFWIPIYSTEQEFQNVTR